MPKTLAEIELLNDPTLSSAEAEWWCRVWLSADLVERGFPAPPPEAWDAPADGPGADAASVFAGMLAGLPLPDGDDGPFTGDAG